MSGAGARAAAYCPRCGVRYDPGSTFCPIDGTRLEPAAPPSSGGLTVGSVIADRYRVVRLLGSGGMGQVYEAEHVSIAKRFALKVLRPEIAAQTEALQRFQREARAASSIGHEAIVKIEDFATLPDGTVYLAMEFLEGRTLADRLNERPLPSFDELTAIVQMICRGLAAAHAHGIVHRDIKPENIFLAGRPGEAAAVKLLDFGIAKMNTDVALTRTGAIFGTPRYMSPEQASGQPVDHRTDIYSVGALLFEALVGRAPFQSDTPMGMLGQHLHSAPPSLRLLAPERGISLALEAVVLDALAKDPRDRPQSMDALLERWTEAIAAGNVAPSAPPPSSAADAPSMSLPSSVPRSRSLLGVVKIVALTFLGTIVLFAWVGTRNRAAIDVVPDAAQPPRPEPEPEPDEEPRPRGSGKDVVSTSWSGVYRNADAFVKLVQHGDRVEGVSMAGDLAARVDGSVRGDTLVGHVSASGRSVGFRATLKKNGSVTVHYDNGTTEKLTRMKTSEIPAALRD